MEFPSHPSGSEPANVADDSQSDVVRHFPVFNFDVRSMDTQTSSDDRRRMKMHVHVQLHIYTQHWEHWTLTSVRVQSEQERHRATFYRNESSSLLSLLLYRCRHDALTHSYDDLLLYASTAHTHACTTHTGIALFCSVIYTFRSNKSPLAFASTSTVRRYLRYFFSSHFTHSMFLVLL